MFKIHSRFLLTIVLLGIGVIAGFQNDFTERQPNAIMTAKTAENADGVIQDPQLARLIRETPLATKAYTFGGLDGTLKLKNTIDITQPLTPENLENLQALYIPSNTGSFSINSLEGLQYARNLKYISFLNLSDRVSSTNTGQITDLSPLKDLSTLQVIQLPKESISDITPIKAIASLKYIELSNQTGKMNGTLDNNNWPNLIALTAVNNNLSGTLDSLKSASNLQDLAITNNHITGTIPDDDWKNMLSFVASNNELTGTLPKTWSKMYNFVAQNNQLSGALPNEWGNNSIYILNIANNQLSGPIPTSWSTIKPFHDLSMQINTSNNQLTSSLSLSGQGYTSRNQELDATNKWSLSGTTASLKLSNRWLGTLDNGRYINQLDSVNQLATTYTASLPQITDINAQPGIYWNVTKPDVLRDDSADSGRNVTFTGKDGQPHNLADLIKIVRDSPSNYHLEIDTSQFPQGTNIPFNIHFVDIYHISKGTPVYASGVITTNLNSKKDSVPSVPTTPSNNVAHPETNLPITPNPTNPSNGLIAKENAAIYSLKHIYLYQNANFKKSERIASYVQKPRVYRPMFVVLDYAKDRNGVLRYHVKDVNHHSQTAGKVGYITGKTSYVRAVYYQGMHRTLTVINPNGINEYEKPDLTRHVKHIKQGAVLNVKKIVTHHLTTRYLLTNGHYVTGNRKLVIAGHQQQPNRVQLKKSLKLYKDVNFKQQKATLHKGTSLAIIGYDFSNKTSMTQTGAKRYVVAGGYITANRHYTKAEH